MAGFAALVALCASSLLASQVLAADQPLWSQCGGKTWTGATKCAGGNACVYVNEYYSQCQATPAPPTSSTVTSAPVISPTFVSSGTTYCGSGPITFKREIVARTCYPAVTTATRYSSTSVVTSYYPSSSCYPYHPSAPACSTSYSTTTGILTTTITVPPPARTAL